MEDILDALKTGSLNGITGIPGQAMNIGSQALSNYIAMRQQRNQTDWYMENYGSPEARMRMMTNAGINGFAAAAGIAGSGGSGSFGPVQAPISSNVGTVTEAGAEATASNLNNANADLAKSQKEGQDIQNEIADKTKDVVVAQKYQELRRMTAEADYWQYYADNYPRMFEGTVANLNKDLDVKSKQIDLYSKQIDEITQKIDNLKEEINLMKTQEGYYRASAGELGARQALEEKQTELTGLQVQRQEWENKVAELYGGDSILATKTELNKLDPGLGDLWYNNMLNEKFEMEMMNSAGNTAGQSPVMMSEMRGMLKDKMDATLNAYHAYEKYQKYSTEVQKLCEALSAGIVVPGYADKAEMIRAVKAYNKAASDARQEYSDFCDDIAEEYNKKHVGLVLGTEAWSLVKSVAPAVVGAYTGGKVLGAAGAAANKVQVPKGTPTNEYGDPDYSYVP